MPESPKTISELTQLLGELADEQLDDAGLARLLELLADDPAARTYYLDFMNLHAQLQWKQANGDNVVVEQERQSADLDVQAEEPLAASSASPSAPLVPPIVIDPSPAGGSSLLTGGWLFSYGAATLILGAAVLISLAWKISLRDDAPAGRGPVAHDAPAAPGPTSRPPRSDVAHVARITAMADCRWRNMPAAAIGAEIAPGQSCVLASGLVEITYRTGATIVLQGPCNYQFDSPAGGFLALGKLAARVESTVESRQSAVGSRQSAGDSRPLPPKFIVRTPTATVTDLGTEFGVEVAPSGETRSQVFQGTVEVRAADSPDPPAVLRSDEMVRVGKTARGKLELRRLSASDARPVFVRQLAKAPMFIDLLDVVAGGNGVRGGRERGIDPATGLEDPLFVPKYRDGDHQYRPVTWHPMIDGVFVPDGAKRPVVTDSAGHEFSEFPRTCGQSWGSIWVRAAELRDGTPPRGEKCWMHAIGPMRQYTPAGRGLLGLHANVGITFDLRAIRRNYPDGAPTQFHAVLGIGDASTRRPDVDGLADFRVLVDGRPRFSRAAMRPKDGPIAVDVDLRPTDRFLTLVATDGGAASPYAGTKDAIVGDWVVLGDPAIKMTGPGN
ncbi:MAG: NPCBM/NEW2 domain-containing protein [Thermoguttaceae bacterium]